MTSAVSGAETRVAYSQTHVDSLDGIRGVAILLVMAYHFSRSLSVLGFANPVLTIFGFFWCGVDVFFALSGFLITGILLDTKTRPGYFRNFYGRRALRIFPLYYMSLAVVILLRAALPDAGVWGEHGSLASPGSMLWPLLYLQNVGIWLKGPAGTGITTHYWSLAVEEHFYLVWPFLLWLSSRRVAIFLAVTAATLSILARVLLYRHGADLDAWFGLTPLRMDGLAIGALAAIAIRGKRGSQALMPWAWITFVLAGAALVCLIVIRHTIYQTDPAVWIFGYPLVGLTTAAALVISLRPSAMAQVLSLRPLRWFGKYSFGLYVWHPIIGVLLFHSQVALVTRASGKPTILLVACLVLALDLLVAWLSFNLWEKRFLDLKRYFAASPPASTPIGAVSTLQPEWKNVALIPRR